MNQKCIGTVVALVLMWGLSVWADEVDILTKIHTVFEGKPPKEEVQSLLNEVIARYGLPPSDDSYERIASVALTLRKDTAVPEMDSLRCTAQLRQGPNALPLEFPQAAALCVSMLAEAPPTHAQILQLQARIAALEEENAQIKAQLAARTVTAQEVDITPAPVADADALAVLDIPVDIEQLIRDHAAKRYADNISMQKAVMKSQRKAYVSLQTMIAPEGVPDEVFAKIQARAAKEYPDSFTMQKAAIRSQCDAYLSIQAMTAPEGVPDEVFAKIQARALKNYPDNFTMQASEIESQCEAYLKLQQ